MHKNFASPPGVGVSLPTRGTFCVVNLNTYKSMQNFTNLKCKHYGCGKKGWGGEGERTPPLDSPLIGARSGVIYHRVGFLTW